MTRAINQLCVAVPPKPPFPPDNVCFRGGGFDDRYRAFFAPGRKFRQPSFLATSFEMEVADRFLARSTMPSKVLWRIRIHPARKCRHVNLVTRRVPNLPDEQEYLFAPYSAFTVREARWSVGTTAQPHEILLWADVDNRDAPEDLPLAPWA